MQRAFDDIKRYHMLEAGDKIVVGVSGGADSLCLLFVLREYQRRVPFSLLAVHVEHGIRGEESREDARFVKELCGSLGVECHCVSRDVPALAQKQKCSLEEAGRQARYAAFEDICRKTGANKIAVAHNQNDQAETMLFQMARGSGLSGACGMRPVRGRIIRPLLGCSRMEIECYLRERGIAWRTDATNESTDYTRNCLRREILPLFESRVNAGTVRHLAKLGDELREIRQYLDSQSCRAAQEMAHKSSGRVEIEVEPFLREQEILQTGILRSCLAELDASLKDLSRVHMESLKSLFLGQSGRQFMLPGGIRAARSFDKVLLWKESGQGQKEEPFLLPVGGPGTYRTPYGDFSVRTFLYKKENILQNQYTKWLDYDKIKGSLFLRTRRPGDFLRIGPEGQKKKIKEYFIEEKIASDARKSILLLADEREILWVVGHRISEAYKVTADTKTVLEVQMMGERDGREGRSINSGRTGE